MTTGELGMRDILHVALLLFGDPRILILLIGPGTGTYAPCLHFPSTHAPQRHLVSAVHIQPERLSLTLWCAILGYRQYMILWCHQVDSDKMASLYLL